MQQLKLQYSFIEDRLQSEAMGRARAVARTSANGVAKVIVPGQQEWLNQHLANESASRTTSEPSTLLSLLPGVNGAINNSNFQLHSNDPAERRKLRMQKRAKRKQQRQE